MKKDNKELSRKYLKYFEYTKNALAKKGQDGSKEI